MKIDLHLPLFTVMRMIYEPIETHNDFWRYCFPGANNKGPASPASSSIGSIFPFKALDVQLSIVDDKDF